MHRSPTHIKPPWSHVYQPARQVNPEVYDVWDYPDHGGLGTQGWSGGYDRPFLRRVFGMLRRREGALAALDPDRIVLRGW